jgi:predicted RNA methylase
MVDESLKAHLERKLVEGGAHAPSRVVSDAPVGNCSASPQDSHPPTEASQSSARAPKTAREARALPIRERLDHLFTYTEEKPDFSEAEVSTLIAAIDEVKILDPACGSGAFPMGVLHKLVYILSKLDPDNERWKQTQLAKLDSAPMREALEATFEDNNDDYGRKLYLIENCLYGVDIQPIAIQITKLRFFISLVCDQKTNRNKKENHGIRPLPNLETKFVAANTLIGLPIQDFDKRDFLYETNVGPLEKEIESAYHSHFNIHRRDQKLTLQRRIKTIRQKLADTILNGLGANKNSEVAKKAQHLAEWDPFDPQSTADFFDPHWMFGRALADGFDVVIGNPPWGATLTKTEKEQLKADYPEIDSSTPNSFAYFVGASLRQSKLSIAFVLPDSILVKDFARTRELVAPKLTHIAWYLNTGVPETCRQFVYVEHDVCVLLMSP